MKRRQLTMVPVFVVLAFVSLPVLTSADDDVSLRSLQVLVTQQATVIQSLQAGQDLLKNRLTAVERDNAALKNELTGVQSKLTTLSRAVAFTVRFKADNEANGIPVGNQATLRFDDVDFNTGNGYDPHTGFFTAPVAGAYSSFLSQMGAGARGYVSLTISRSGGGPLDLVYCQDHGSSLVTAHLGAGEQVWVQQAQGSAVRGAWYTVFSGFLLKAD